MRARPPDNWARPPTWASPPPLGWPPPAIAVMEEIKNIQERREAEASGQWHTDADAPARVSANDLHEEL